MYYSICKWDMRGAFVKAPVFFFKSPIKENDKTHQKDGQGADRQPG